MIKNSNDNSTKKMLEEKTPIAAKHPKIMEIHGDVRTDNYYWLNEKENPKVLDYLNAENDYYHKVTAHTDKFQESLFQEMKGRIKEDDSSVPYKFNGYYYITKYIKTYSELGFQQSKLWKAGTLCITIAANIAKTGILTFDACFPDSVVGFTPDKKVTNILYIHHLFGFFQMILEKNAPQAAQKNINLDILRNLRVPKPPIQLQNKFASIVEKIETIKVKYQVSLEELEGLYGSLSQRAFKGELDLSGVVMER